jgi:hypothetical protein
MKFFTKDLWLALQDRTRNVIPLQEQASRAYRAQLQDLRPRLSRESFQFFLEADVHDGELLGLAIIDGSRPAPLTEPTRPWETLRNHPIRVKLSVLDAMDKLIWHLSYTTVRRLLVDFPTEQPLFHQDGNGFGDWGYHELTDVGSGFLRHEILFATGAVLLFEFKQVDVTFTLRSQADTSGHEIRS